MARTTGGTTNLFIFDDHLDEGEPGLWHNLLDYQLPVSGAIVKLPTFTIGPSWARWSEKIRPTLDLKDQPVIDGRKIVFASFVDEGEGDETRTVIAKYRDENANYVRVKTGARALEGPDGGKSFANHWIKMAAEGITAVSHGAYDVNFELLKRLKNEVAKAEGQADDRAAMREMLKDPGLSLRDRPKATVVGKPRRQGRHYRGIGPEVAEVLWRMPFGSELLVRTIEGFLKRIVSKRFGIEIHDASGWNDYFNMLENIYRAAKMGPLPPPTIEGEYKIVQPQSRARGRRKETRAAVATQ